MTILATTWLALSTMLCVFTWFKGGWRHAVLLPLTVALAAYYLYIPTGSPRYTTPPAGKYTVLGFRIDVDVAIWALLDDGKGVPTYYRLPYSASQANSLQQAHDGAENGSGVQATVNGEGGVAYDGDPPVTGEPPKVPETPQISLP